MKAVMSKEVHEILKTVEGRKKLIDATLELSRKDAESSIEIVVQGNRHKISLVSERN